MPYAAYRRLISSFILSTTSAGLVMRTPSPNSMIRPRNSPLTTTFTVTSKYFLSTLKTIFCAYFNNIEIYRYAPVHFNIKIIFFNKISQDAIRIIFQLYTTQKVYYSPIQKDRIPVHHPSLNYLLPTFFN